MKEENKVIVFSTLELKITPVHRGGFIIKVFNMQSNSRSPVETFVAKDYLELASMVTKTYNLNP